MRPYVTGQYQQGAFSPGQMVPAFNLDEDPYAASVVSLLHANGAQGQTTFSDSIAGITWTNTSGSDACIIDRTTSPFHDQVGPYSINMNAPTSYLLSNASSSLSPGSGVFTIEGFAKLGRGSATDPCLFDNRSASNAGIAIYANIAATSNFGFVAYNSTGVIAASDIPIGNTWVHWCVMRTSALTSNLYLFLDGKYLAGGTDTRTYAATPSIYLGSGYTGIQYLLGWMSEFRMTLAARYTLPGSFTPYQQIFTPPTLPFPNP